TDRRTTARSRHAAQFFVDDDIYADIFDPNAPEPTERIEQAVASGIEAIFILLGASDLSLRQDPLSWDKLQDFIVNFRGKVLGVDVCTRSLAVSVPPDYLAKTTALLKDNWAHRKSFFLREIAELTGVLCHISSCAPWLKYLMPHIYCSPAEGPRTYTLLRLWGPCRCIVRKT
ncbi:hypothetical protein THAOC_03043, partial [Thalassiosira oceanica]